MANDNNETEARVLSADERRDASKRADDKAANAEYKPRTAHDVVAEVGPVDVSHAQERARKAGVTDVAFVDYEEALKNYESRPDVEPLKERRAREGGREFSDAAFRRQIGGTDNAGVTTSEDVSVAADDKTANKTSSARKPSGK